MAVRQSKIPQMREELREIPSVNEAVLFLAVVERALLDWYDLPECYEKYPEREARYLDRLKRRREGDPTARTHRRPENPKRIEGLLRRFFFEEKPYPCNLKWIAEETQPDPEWFIKIVRDTVKLAEDTNPGKVRKIARRPINKQGLKHHGLIRVEKKHLACPKKGVYYA